MQLKVIPYRLMFVVACGFLGILNHGTLYAQDDTFCHLYGGVFVVDQPQKADALVYIETSEFSADLLVYKEENLLMADNSGLWHFTTDQHQAQFYIMFTKTLDLADFSVYFTDEYTYAGCK